MANLPAGVELYLFDAAGTAVLVNGDETVRLGSANGLLRFIDDGQFARYFIGSPETSPERPTNATYKLGVVRPHSGFTPHAHGGEHVVLSLGYGSCGLYDEARQAVVTVHLPPGAMIRIPAMLPHSFGNRSDRPLLILAANTGYGIAHPDYAVTADEAERRAADDVDYPALAKALRQLEDSARRPGPMTRRERFAARLRQLASYVERAR
jgi:hypothetical protein